MGRITLIDVHKATDVEALLIDDDYRLSAEAVAAATGWELKSEGLCHGARCIPLKSASQLIDENGFSLQRLGGLLNRPVVINPQYNVASLGASANERAEQLRSREAPDFVLPDMDGKPHRLSNYRGNKVLLIAYASWWGCRYDLPVWQKLYEELKNDGLVVITVALDKDADAAKPWIEKAKPTHPSLIDSKHIVADLYGMVNVPTGVWIGETGRIVHPNDVIFGSNKFKAITGVDSKKHLNAIRNWVRNDVAIFADKEVSTSTPAPTAIMQQARAEFAVGQWLYDNGQPEAAEAHFVRAGELAPNDFTIRRGTMPMRNLDPMGAEFGKMVWAWRQAGHSYYLPQDW